MSDTYVEVKGWLIKRSTDINEAKINVVLKSKDSGDYYKLPTKQIETNEVTEYFHDGYKYDKSCFSMKIPTKKQYHLEDSTYEIFLLYKVNDEVPVLINTQRSCIEIRK